jgi:hypothetical protein
MNETKEIVRLASPMLVKVTVCGIEVVASSLAANVSDAADKETVATPPVPSNERYVNLLVTLSVT